MRSSHNGEDNMLSLRHNSMLDSVIIRWNYGLPGFILDRYGSRGLVCQRSGKTHWKEIEAFAFHWSRITQNIKVVQSQLSILIDKKHLVQSICSGSVHRFCFFWLSHFFTTCEPWFKNSTSSVLVYYRVAIPKWNSSHIQSRQICHHHHWCRATHQTITLKAEQPETRWHSEIVTPDQTAEANFPSVKCASQRQPLCVQMLHYPVNSCRTGSRFIPQQTDRAKNDFTLMLRGVTVWALYLNSKQHSQGHNYQSAGKEANLPISY